MDLGTGYINLVLRERGFVLKASVVDAKLQALSRRMTAVSASAKRMLMIGGAIAFGTIKALNNFEKQMDMVSTMLDEQSMKLMPQYEMAMKKLAKSYGEGTKTISKGLYDILSASVDATKALDVLEVSIKAARAGFSTTAISADAITTILNAYSLEAERAGDISDLLFAIVKRGKITFAELSASIGQIASVSAIAGLSLEELGASIATLTRTGLKARITMTALRSLIVQFLTPTVEASKVAWEEFGLVLDSSTLKSIGLSGVLKKLAGATAEQLAVIIPNIRGYVGLAAALQNVEGHAIDLNLMINRVGKTQEAYAKTTENLYHKMNQLWQSIKIMAVGIGEALSPKIEEITEKIIAATEATTEWVSANAEFVTSIVATTAKLALAVIAIEKLLKVVLALKAIVIFLVATPIALTLYAIALALGSVYIAGKKIGTAMGDWWNEIEALEFKYKAINKEANEFNAAAKDLWKSQARLFKIQSELRAMSRDRGSIKYLEKQKEVSIAAHEVEQKRLATAKERIGISSQTTRKYGKSKEHADFAKQEMLRLEAQIQKQNEIIKSIKEAENAERKQKIFDEKMSKHSITIAERIKDLEVQIADTREDSNIEIIKANREYEKLLKILEKAEQKASKELGGILPKGFEQERIKLQELLQEKLKAIERKGLEDIHKEEKRKAEELADLRKTLMSDYIRATSGELEAQLHSIESDYNMLAKKFKGDAEALRMLEAVIENKVQKLINQKATKPRIGFADPASLWKQMTQSLNNAGGQDTQKKLLSEFIQDSRRKERNELTAMRQRQKSNEFLRKISVNKEGSLRR